MDRGEDVVRQLYGRWRGPLRGYVLRLVGGDHRYAEEVVQETLRRARGSADVLTPEEAGPWLYAVARALVASGFRSAGGERPEEPPAEVDAVDHALQGWQVAEALRGLSRDHRDAVVELHYRRRTVAEAAAALGIPQGAVKSRCFYGLRALRDALAERGVTEP
ncbi:MULTISPECIES: sigma factor-like helix-turn-helix DNA-binding protein [Actinosynnema]|uniref:sigma factor-like helix-turn-helix DNA-binding protein n=1 Tax=Actinosynnema TaxID=40566 RepID=UPI0020A26EDC|nr:sigma factor-like helix-turn-helix DNA-binding protein [Actinosynnema pretiosum]